MSRLRCVQCGFCADEDLREADSIEVTDTGRRHYQTCDVCQGKTIHREEDAVRILNPDWPSGTEPHVERL